MGSHEARALLRIELISADEAYDQDRTNARDTLLCDVHEWMERIVTQMKHADYLQTTRDFCDGTADRLQDNA